LAIRAAYFRAMTVSHRESASGRVNLNLTAAEKSVNQRAGEGTDMVPETPPSLRSCWTGTDLCSAQTNPSQLISFVSDRASSCFCGRGARFRTLCAARVKWGPGVWGCKCRCILGVCVVLRGSIHYRNFHYLLLRSHHIQAVSSIPPRISLFGLVAEGCECIPRPPERTS